MIAISQDKLICNKVGTATISKFQQEIIAILREIFGSLEEEISKIIFN